MSKSLIESRSREYYKSLFISGYLTRNAAFVFTIHEFTKLIRESIIHGNKIKMKWGIDPSGDYLHLGHFVCLRKIKEFLRALPNSHAQIVFGTATVFMHDSSGKKVVNYSNFNTQDSLQIAINRADNFKLLIKHFMQPFDDRVTFHYNHEWLFKMDILNFLLMIKNVKVNDVLQKFKAVNLSLSSVVYPSFQAYDSFFLDNDIEFGGADQLTNILLVRDIAKECNKKKEIGLMLPLLTNSDGEKMSKSQLGALLMHKDNIANIFKSIMSASDSVFLQYLNMLSSKKYKIDTFRDFEIAKKRFCIDLMQEIFGDEMMNETISIISLTDRKGSIKDIPITSLRIASNDNALSVVNKLFPDNSASYNRRLFHQEAIKMNGEPIKYSFIFPIETEVLLSVGKRCLMRLWLTH